MDFITIPFPKDLYDRIVIRSGGKLDPATLAVDQVEAFIERNADDPSFWTPEGLAAFQAERGPDTSSSIGDPSLGYQWQNVFLPNGTRLRMKYRDNYYYADVRHEKVVDDGQQYTPAQWVRKVANHTARNAWHDIWVLFPGESNWHYSDNLRRRQTK